MRITTIAVAAFALAFSVALAITRAHAQDAPAGGAYEVLKAGDRDMSCQQLAAEANGLNATILARQNRPQGGGNGGRVGDAVAGGLLKSAGHFGLARFGGAIPGVGGLIARQVAQQVTDSAADAVANGGQQQDAAQAAPVTTPEQQRMNHLLGLYKEKTC